MDGLTNYIAIGLLVVLVLMWYQGTKSWIWAPVLTALIYVTIPMSIMAWSIYGAVLVLFLLPLVRRYILSAPLVVLLNKLKLLPNISATEKTALLSGTVWMDGEIFSGKPNFKKVLSEPYPTLSEEEIAFLNNEVNEVCAMTNDYKVFQEKDLPEDVWQYLKDKKFFGMIVPKEYGGLGFSALGHSAVIQKLATHSQGLAITVMVPNSLGPAELIHHYGTQDQKTRYLERLATGKEIPCFALTEPLAGSDATSIRSSGVLFKEGDTLKIRLNFDKRYITLGGIATLIGLAFTLRDPEGLLGGDEDLGITCGLIPSTTPGITQGLRHDPLGVPFVNSPLYGKDVVISIDDVIGGKEGIGVGWVMLNESLAVGRGISLPSTSTGGVKLSARVAGSYSMIREQFGISVGLFEGIEQELAKLAARTYMLDAARIFTIGAIDSGKKPAVITAVMKYHSTEMFRDSINDAMDIVGGAGISLGDKNLLGAAYMGAPIAITVEGANIMTRTLLQFGQGMIRCHPYVYKEIDALETGNVKAFDVNFWSHVGLTLRNKLRMILLSLTRGYLYMPRSRGIAADYERKLAWTSATFAFLTDFLMLFYGGSLRQKEKLSARLGDVLSNSYLLMATIRRFKEGGYSKEEKVFMRYNGDMALSNIQNAFDELFMNLFESKILHFLTAPLRWYARINRMGIEVKDKDTNALAKTIFGNSKMRDTLTDGIYYGKRLTEIEEGVKLHEASLPLIRKMRKAMRKRILPKAALDTLVDMALEKNVLTNEEHALLKKAYQVKHDIVQVDSYKIEDYVKRM
ncbi:MAG: acyl-CoA dehydrogenase [Thiovulaceae bacterium]|nr:acyl-CoA dehydrogenase [Sulfurimonadaceae bacterium]